MSLLCESTLSPHHFNDQPTGWAAARLRGIAKKLPPRDQFYTTSISQEDPKIWRGGRSDDRCKNVGEDRRRGIAVGWWVRICQKAEMSVPSTAETAFLILSVTHYLERAAIFRTFTWTLQVTQIPRHSTVKSGDLDFKIPYIWVLLYETNNSRLEVRFVRKITESRCISILFWSVRLQRCKWHLACRTRGE